MKTKANAATAFSNVVNAILSAISAAGSIAKSSHAEKAARAVIRDSLRDDHDAQATYLALPIMKDEENNALSNRERPLSDGEHDRIRADMEKAIDGLYGQMTDLADKIGDGVELSTVVSIKGADVNVSFTLTPSMIEALPKADDVMEAFDIAFMGGAVKTTFASLLA